MSQRIMTAVAAFAVAGTTLVLGAGVASAAPANGGCPAGGGWTERAAPAWGPIPGIDHGNAQDQNGDGQLCVRWVDFFHAVYKDNTGV